MVIRQRGDQNAAASHFFSTLVEAIGAFGPIDRSSRLVRFRYLATVFGLMP